MILILKFGIRKGRYKMKHQWRLPDINKHEIATGLICDKCGIATDEADVDLSCEEYIKKVAYFFKKNMRFIKKQKI